MALARLKTIARSPDRTTIVRRTTPHHRRPSRIPQLIPLMRASLSHTWRPSQHVEAAGEETESVQLSGVIGSSPLPPFGVSRPRGVLERGDERSRRAGDGCGVLVLLAPGGS